MFAVKVEITRYVDDSQPGWVECRLIDAYGRVWLFVEKAPIVTDANLDADSVYPQQASIACRIVQRRIVDSRGIVSIDTEEPCSVETTTGETRFDVLAEQVFELPPRKLPDIGCLRHGGRRRRAFLCRHLADGSGVGFVTSPRPEDSWYGPDEQWAWCSDCENVRVEQDGWTEVMGKHAQMHIVCIMCFEDAKTRNSQ